MVLIDHEITGFNLPTGYTVSIDLPAQYTAPPRVHYTVCIPLPGATHLGELPLHLLGLGGGYVPLVLHEVHVPAGTPAQPLST